MLERDEAKELQKQAEFRLLNMERAYYACEEKYTAVDAENEELRKINERLKLSDEDCQRTTEMYMEEARKEKRNGNIKAAGGIVVGIFIAIFL